MKTKITISILLTAISLGLFAQSVTISPNKGLAGQTFAVTISGKNTFFKTGINTVNFVFNSAITSDVIFSNQNVLNDSVITGTVSISNTIPNPFYFALRISNSINSPINLVYAITIPDADTIIPRLYSTDNSRGFNIGQSTYLRIRGKNTHLSTAKNNTIKFYKYGIENKSISISNFSVYSSPYPYEL